MSEAWSQRDEFFADGRVIEPRDRLMDMLESYHRQAMKLAVLNDLCDEGYAVRIPRSPSLLATGRAKREALADLDDALAWIALALKARNRSARRSRVPRAGT